MNNSIKTLLLTAAASGLLAGTTATTRASVLPSSGTSSFLMAGKTTFGSFNAKAPKHSCKGQNDCKGQGGCKSSDNGCKGKNSCKGKGGCATDGSKNSCGAMAARMV
jgi:hypothetical protein